MQLVRVGASALNQTPLDWDGNRARILAVLEEARARGISILCLPELCISGYGCEDMFLSPSLAATALQVLQEILPATRGLAVSLGLPLSHRNMLFNVACLAVDGRVAGFSAKRFLAGEGIHYEPRWFKPWPEGVRAEVRLGQASVPLGDLHFEVGGVGIGFEICEDAWAVNRPGEKLSAQAVDVIMNPSASHFAFGKLEVRKRLVLEGSRTFGVCYLYANLLGNEAGRAIYDGGPLIACGGQLLACGRRFSFRDFTLEDAVVDLELVRMQKMKGPTLQAALGDDNAGRVEIPFSYPAIEPERPGEPLPCFETSARIKEEEFTRAEGLALFDYLRKSRSAGFVISLSGGADSSAIACLVATLVEMGVAELGMPGLVSRLGLRADSLPENPGIPDLVRALLCCVYQATENSSDVTFQSARGVAEAIGAEFFRFDVTALVEGYQSMVSRALGRELSWATDDLTLQNIQARVRAPGVWMLANIKNALLLATSNRSEAAVGYATMDGDTCGGLAPIAGIDKAFVRVWLRWMEEHGPFGLHPIAALSLVNCQKPTAELRPSESHQTDEEDLMPYEVLDAIERAAIRDKQNPLDIFRLMGSMFPEHPSPLLATWVERFFRLWARNQWKRERYAPSFHLDDENLDPKTWCRFPILSGGFARELTELRAHLQALDFGKGRA